MKLLAEIISEDFIHKYGGDSLPRNIFVAKNVRGILKNENGEFAVAYPQKRGFHTLPGGGVEKGEDLESAVIREMKEETGFDTEIEDEIGCTFEFKINKFGNESLIITYCYLLKTIGEEVEKSLTEHEKQLEFEMTWLDLGDALKVLQDDYEKTKVTGYGRERDLLFLEEYKNNLNIIN